ncbi:MAG TPA: hypothetical protein VGD76_09500 [Ramlibacter sp.]
MKKKIDAVKRYLSDQFTGRYIEHQADFDRNAQTFKVHLQEGTLLLKVSDELLRDNTPSDIRLRLEDAAVGGLLWGLKGTDRGLLVASTGATEFPRG